MKSLVAMLGVLLAGSVNMASTPDTVGCYASALTEARKVYGSFREDRSTYPQKYEGSKVVVYEARLEQNGGTTAIEAVVEKGTCSVLKIYTVWAD